MPTDEPTDLAQVARELYAVVPAQFVAARNARAAQLRQAGEREPAAAVKKLPKATAAAWAVSAVVREAGGDLDALGELGAELRVAQRLANPAELRSLSRRRREQVAALTRTAVRIAAEHEVDLSPAAQEQVRATWQAVVIDPRAERAVRSGLLPRALEPGQEDLAAAPALPVDLGESAPAAGDGEPEPTTDDDEPGPMAEDDEAEPATDDDEPAPEDDDEAGPTAEHEPAPTAADDEPKPRGTSRPRSRVGTERPTPARKPRSGARAGACAENSHVRGGMRIRRAAAPADDEAAPSSPLTAVAPDGGAGQPAAPSGDVAREIRRLRRDLRSRQRIAEQMREELDEATEELGRVEAQVLQLAARREELRREVAEVEEELEKLDEVRAGAREEREDAADRDRAAAEQLAGLRERLAELEG